MYKLTSEGCLEKEHDGYKEYLRLGDILRQLGIDDFIMSNDMSWIIKTIKMDLLKLSKKTLENSMSNNFKNLKDRVEYASREWNNLKQVAEQQMKHHALGIKLIFFVLLAKIHFYASIIPKSLLKSQEKALYLHEADTLYLQEIRAFTKENEENKKDIKHIRCNSLYNFFPPFEREYICVLVTVSSYELLKKAFHTISIDNLIGKFISNASEKAKQQFLSYIQLNLAHCRCFKHKHKNITAKVVLKLWDELYKNVLKRVIGKGLLSPELEVIYFIWSAKIHFYTLISNKKEANMAYFIAIKNFVKNYRVIRVINGVRFKVYLLSPADDGVIFAVLTQNFNEAGYIARDGKYTNNIGNYVVSYFPKQSSFQLSDEVKNTIKKHFEIIKKSLNVHSCYKFKSFIATYCQIIQQPAYLSAKEQIPPKKVA